MRAMYVIILTAACQRRQLKDPPLAFHSLYAALHELPARKYQEFKTSTQCKVSSTRLTTVDILVQDLRLYCSVIKCPTLPEHLYSSFDQSSADQQLYKAVYCGLPGQSTLTRRATVMWFTVTLFLNNHTSTSKQTLHQISSRILTALSKVCTKTSQRCDVDLNWVDDE